MKWIYYGNQGNLGFRYVRWLRQRKIDATLLFAKNDASSRSLPEWEDPNIQGNYPSFMKTYRQHGWHQLVPPFALQTLAKKAELILTSGLNIISALAVNIPVIFIPVGWDMNQLPFFSTPIRREILSYYYRKRICRVARILTTQPDCIFTANLLGVGDKIRRIPIPTDIVAMEGNTDRLFLQKMTEHYRRYDLVLLHTSRKNLDPRRPDYKGNEKLLHAYKRFIESGGERKTILVTGAHGNDVSKYKELVTALHLTDLIEFVDHLDLPKLHALFQLPNAVVFDQFVLPKSSNLSGTSREALSLGTIVVGRTDPLSSEFIANYGPGCPSISACTEEELFRVLCDLNSMEPHKLLDKKRQAKEWATRYLDVEKRIDEIIEAANEVIHYSF